MITIAIYSSNHKAVVEMLNNLFPDCPIKQIDGVIESGKINVFDTAAITTVGIGPMEPDTVVIQAVKQHESIQDWSASIELRHYDRSEAMVTIRSKFWLGGVRHYWEPYTFKNYINELRETQRGKHHGT